MTDYEILELAHRTCWKYNHVDENNRFTFNNHTMIELVRKIERKIQDGIRSDYETWQGPYKPIVKVALTHCLQRIDPDATL